MSEVLTQLPPEALQRHLAILGTSDAGKTYAAKGEVERLLDAGARVFVIDPTGVWWGLRLQPDGETPSRFELPIFGGVGPRGRTPPHCDVPIAETAGARLAELVAEGDFSGILDVSRMSVGGRTRLFADFADALAAENRRPLHLVIDEAHLFAPQGRVQDPQSARMLGAANHLVAGGRALGLKLMLLSQRAAKLHKDSLTQVQTLVAMYNVSPQDRAAIGDWIKDAADAKQGREILASLPGLLVGQGWVWAPRLDVLQRIDFPAITTFDSSATPESGVAAPAAGRSLAALDLTALRAALADDTPAATAKGASASPSRKALDEAHARGVAEGREAMRRELAARPLAADPAVQRLIRNAERGGAAAALERLRAGFVALVERELGALPAFTPDPNEGAQAPAAPPAGPSAPSAPPAAPPAPPAARPPSKPARSARKPPAGAETGLTEAANELITAARLAPRPVYWAEAAILSGRMPQGGSFQATRKLLRDTGWAEPQDNDLVDERELMAPGYFELIDQLVPKLSTGKHGLEATGRAFRLVAEFGPLTREQLAERMQLAGRGGHWENLWKRLRTSPLTVATDAGVDVAPILQELRRAVRP